MNCDPQKEEKAIQEVRNLNDVKSCEQVTGAFDLIAEVEVESEKDLAGLISSKMRHIEGIKSTVTLRGVEGQE